MEQWKDIKGFEGVYQVSDSGKVKRIIDDGERVLKATPNKDGYLRVRLLHLDDDFTRTVHRLVAETFIPCDDPNLTVNHKDGNKRNNNLNNLEWVDRSEQMYHAYSLGLKKPIRGSKNKNAKLSAEDVRYIRRVYKRQSTEFGTVALSKKFGVTNRVIGLIVRGLSYKDV